MVFNKIDVAPLVGADLSIMERDARIVRGDQPYVFVPSTPGHGVARVANHIAKYVLFDKPPKAIKAKANH